MFTDAFTWSNLKHTWLLSPEIGIWPKRLLNQSEWACNSWQTEFYCHHYLNINQMQREDWIMSVTYIEQDVDIRVGLCDALAVFYT